MATFQLTNGYNPLVYGYLVNQRATQKNAIIRSGMAAQSSYLQGKLAGGGQNYEFSDYKQLTHSAPNLSDDSNSNATAENITNALQKGRLIVQNKMWAVKDFAKDLVGQNPVTAITNQIGDVWGTILQKEMVSSLLGILADNIANDASDMVYNIANDNVAAVADAERISATAIIRAKQTSGDMSDGYRFIVMHSLLKARLAIQNLISFIPNSRGETMFETYGGLQIIEDDDALLLTTGVNRITYTCILAGADVIGLASGEVSHPFAMDRDEKTGLGGGEDFFHSRRSDAIHPWGFSFAHAGGGALAGQSATYAELATAAKWDRVWPRKNVKIAFLKVND
jgi:hypothetical protein